MKGDVLVGAGRAASWAATVATSFLISASSLPLPSPSPAALPEPPYLTGQGPLSDDPTTTACTAQCLIRLIASSEECSK